jgi:head-tail adaptor
VTQAGEFRDVIVIQRPVAVQDTFGQEDISYEVFEEDVRARITPLSGHEYIAARQVVADVTTRIKIRRIPGIEPSFRIVRTIEDDSPPTVETYDIAAVLPDPVSGLRYLTLLCVQRFAEGFRRGA